MGTNCHIPFSSLRAGFPLSKPDEISQLEQDVQIIDLETKNREVLRAGCSDGVTREENKLIPKQESSEDVPSHKVRIGRLKQVIALVPETREVYKPEDKTVRLWGILRNLREFRQITISKETCTNEKNNECSEPEKASVQTRKLLHEPESFQITEY